MNSVKGTAQKCESLQDGSLKLSIYFDKSQKAAVWPLDGEEVELRIAGQGGEEVQPEDASLTLAKLSDTMGTLTTIVADATTAINEAIDSLKGGGDES